MSQGGPRLPWRFGTANKGGGASLPPPTVVPDPRRHRSGLGLWAIVLGAVFAVSTALALWIWPNPIRPSSQPNPTGGLMLVSDHQDLNAQVELEITRVHGHRYDTARVTLNLSNLPDSGRWYLIASGQYAPVQTSDPSHALCYGAPLIHQQPHSYSCAYNGAPVTFDFGARLAVTAPDLARPGLVASGDPFSDKQDIPTELASRGRAFDPSRVAIVSGTVTRLFADADGTDQVGLKFPIKRVQVAEVAAATRAITLQPIAAYDPLEGGSRTRISGPEVPPSPSCTSMCDYALLPARRRVDDVFIGFADLELTGFRRPSEHLDWSNPDAHNQTSLHWQAGHDRVSYVQDNDVTELKRVEFELGDTGEAGAASNRGLLAGVFISTAAAAAFLFFQKLLEEWTADRRRG